MYFSKCIHSFVYLELFTCNVVFVSCVQLFIKTLLYTLGITYFYSLHMEISTNFLQKGFIQPRADDGLLEIFGLFDGWHASLIMLSLRSAKRLAQV